MLELSTTGYQFVVDGTNHTLPELNIDTFATIANLVTIEDRVEQMTAWRDALIEIAPPETGDVIRKLGIKQTTQLFRDWAGLSGGQVSPGESSSSPE